MEQKPKPQTPFDDQVCPQKLQFMKLLLPYISPSMQSMLGIFIKFQELQYTVRFFQTTTSAFSMQEQKAENLSLSAIMEDFLPYLNPKQSEMLQSLSSALQMFEMFQNLSSPDASIKDMISPEQQEMFDFYSNMFSQDWEHAYDDTKTAQKEDA